MEIRDRRGRTWFWLDNAIYDIGLSPYALAVLGLLARYADREGECYPTHKTVAGKAGMSQRQVKYALQELRDAGVIAIGHRTTKGGANASNVYRLLSAPWQVVPHPLGTTCPPPQAHSAPPPGTQCPTILEQDPIEQDPSEQEEESPTTNKDDDFVVVVGALEKAGIQSHMHGRIIEDFERQKGRPLALTDIEGWAKYVDDNNRARPGAPLYPAYIVFRLSAGQTNGPEPERELTEEERIAILANIERMEAEYQAKRRNNGHNL